MSEVVIGADFGGLEASTKKNEKIATQVEKSMKKSMSLLEAAQKNREKVLRKMLVSEGFTNVNWSGPKGASGLPTSIGNQPFTSAPGGRPSAGRTAATVAGQQQAGQQMNVIAANATQAQAQAPAAASQFASALNIAKAGVIAFAAVVVSGMAAIQARAAANEEAGGVKMVAGRAANALGGKASAYEAILDKMGPEERKGAMQFLERTTSMRVVDNVKTPLAAISGGLQGIYSGRMSAGDAIGNLTQTPKLSALNLDKSFLNDEAKIRGLEGNAGFLSRNIEVEDTERARLKNAGWKVKQAESPFLTAVGDKLTGGNGAFVYGSSGIQDAVNLGFGLPSLSGPEAPPSPGGVRPGVMGSQRGNGGDSAALLSTMQAAVTELRKISGAKSNPPIGAGKD